MLLLLLVCAGFVVANCKGGYCSGRDTDFQGKWKDIHRKTQ